MTGSTSPASALKAESPAETKVCWVYLWRDLDLERATPTNCWARHLLRCINSTDGERQACRKSSPMLKNKFNLFLNNYGWIILKNFLHFIFSCWHCSCSCFLLFVCCFVLLLQLHISLLALSVLSRVLQAAESPGPKPQAHISFWCLGMTEQLTQNLIYLRWEGEREATS